MEVERYFAVGDLDCYEHVHQSFFQGNFEINKADSQGRTLLHHACIYGKWEAVEKLVKIEGIDSNLQDRDGCTPLHLACIHGHVKCVQQLVEILLAFINVITQDLQGYTPLHYACENGHFQCVQSLLKIQCKVGRTPVMMQDKSGKTALHYACETNNIELAKVLFVAGADPKVQDSQGCTPLHYLCANGQLNTKSSKKLLKGFIYADSRPNIYDIWDCTPLHYACSNNTATKAIVRILTDAGAQTHVQDVDGRTPLHFASANQNVTKGMLEVLIGAGANLCAKDSKGNTPLHYACTYGFYQSAKYLILKSMDSNTNLKSKNEDGINPTMIIVDSNSRTILHHACMKNDLDLVQKLVTSGADPNVQDIAGSTPLHYACEYGHYQCAALLISHSQDPRTLLQTDNKDGHTLQMMHKSNNKTINHYACDQSSEHSKRMNMLIDAGTPHMGDGSGCTPLDCVDSYVTETKITSFIGVVDLNTRDLENCTPLHVVCGSSNIRDNMLQVLLKGGADPNAQDTQERTPLHYACANPQATDKALKVLLDAGADPTTEDSYACIPFHYACAYGDYSSYKYLILNSFYFNAAFHSHFQQGYSFAMGKDHKCKTIFHHACEKGDLEFVAKLITENVDSGVQDSMEYTPLHYACENGHFEVAQLLIIQCQNSLTMLQHQCKDRRTPAVMADKNKKTMLHHACKKGDDVLVEKLVTAGADFNAQDVKGYTPLHYACENGYFEVVKYLKSQNPLTSLLVKSKDGHTPPMMADEKGRTMLHHVCEKGKSNALLVENLVTAGADLNAQDVQGYTPLHYACEKGRVGLVEKLVKLNADVNAQDNNGWTPVMTVVHDLSGKNEQEKIVKSLLSSKVRCDLDMQANVTKNTALHLACTVGNSTGVQLLLSNGAGVDYLNSTGHTPLHTACSQYQGSDASRIRGIIFLLRSHNCDVNIKDMHGKTALHCSVYCQDPSIALSLIAGGCDITAKDNQGQRFSDLAPLSLMQKVKKELLSLERRQIVCVIGHPKCGKSTLIAALEGNQAEYGQVYRFFFKPFTNINLTNIRTAGIEAKVIDGQSLQHVIFFDFAGQAEYYSSHLAFLESALSVKSGTTVTFIMMTDGRCTEEERFDQCMEWLFPIKTILKEHNQLDVLLVCSHFDQLWFWQQWNVIASLESISDKLNELLNCKNVNFKDHWGMDCRKMASAGISKLEQHLQNQRKQRLSDDSTSKVPLAACVLFDKLQKKSLNLPISVDDIALKLKNDEPPFPLTRGFIDGLCRELASSGLALYICDQLNIGKNLLILEIGEVLTRIHGKLFAPNSQDFPMHHRNLANKFGLVNVSELERAFKDSPLKPDVIGRFLIAMEFCHPVDADLLNSEIGQLLGTTEPGLQAANSRNWLCFPSLVSTDPPKQKLFGEKHIELCPWMCWELRTVNPHYFTPRFQHALFVRLGAKYVHHDTDDSQSEIIKHSCQVWKNGMFWSHRSGVHICIEIKQKCIVQILASGKPNLQPPKMNPVINLVSGVAQEVHIVKDHHSPGVATTSYLRKVVRGSPSDCCVLVNNFINAIKDNQEYVNNKEDGSLINIGDFLDDWNPCLSILDNMVLVKRSEVEAVTLSPCSSSEPEHTHSLDLPTPSDTTMVQRVSQSLPIATVHTELPSSHMRGFHKTADNSFNLLPSTHQSVSISRSQLVCNTDILEPTSYSLPKLSEVDLTEESLNFHIGKCIGDSWEKFATHLHIHRKVIEGVHKECSGIVRDCFVVMTRKWLHSEIGTGDLPRTWQTVCDALEKIDHPDIAEDIKETLLVETGEVKVQMLLNKYRDRFYSDVDSHAIYRRLEVEGVIPNSLAFKIERTPVKESNDMLFLHLRDHGDMETLRRFCDVLITVGEDGYPRMLQMGQSFQDSISQHIQVAPFESI